jgi:hypothetical protein
MRVTRFAAVLAVLALWVGWPTLAHAQADDFSVGDVDPDLPMKIKAWNAECVACHSEQGVKSPPRPDMDLAKLGKLVFDTGRFARSVHAEMACKDCHGDATQAFPHAPQAAGQIKSCPDCHQGPAKTIVPEFKASIHYSKHPGAFSCESCHDAHTWRKAIKTGSMHETAAQDNGMCLSCHNSDLKYAAIAPNERRPDLEEAHAFLPNPRLHWSVVRCVDCHTPEKVDAISHEIQAKDKAERRCVACHSAQSSLRVRLYRYFSENEHLDKAGFLNAFVLNEAYVVGATRNAWLELISFVVFGLLVAALAGHGLIRIIAYRRRKGRK